MAWREVLAAALLLLAVASAQNTEGSPECGECDRSSCPEVGSCLGGVVADLCGCCQVCARGLGQRCDPEGTQETQDTPRYGPCGRYLHCTARTDLKDSSEATCECEEAGPVCGSDGLTYPTLCHLLQDTADNPDLYVTVRGPCKAAPVIKSKPEDTTRPLGSILVLDCEVAGYPVPEVTWELNKPDGSSFRLPSDDPAFAVQVRGGPDTYMVTGWVQIMKITEKNLGIYTCVATNSEGEARASATVSEDRTGGKTRRKA